jgi:cholesterol oxidase
MDNFDAIVIGTGFGGTIAATKLVAKGKKVLMLERGTWWITPEKLGKPPEGAKKPIPVWAKEQNPPHPVQYWPRPDYKDGMLDFFASMRLQTNKDGLYQYSMFKEADILTASGVGGGSLIYSNVTVRPQAEVLGGIGLNLGDAEYQAAQDWMADFRGKLQFIVTKIPLPGKDVKNLNKDDDYLYLDRARVLRDAGAKAAAKLGLQMPWEPLPLSVVEYEDGPTTGAGKTHTFCERQGRCILGCLPAARHTLNKTLYNRILSDPTKGAALYPLAEVRDIKRVADGYEVNFIDNRNGQKQTAKAALVFLAAGTLGTTEILLRSRDKGGLKFHHRPDGKFLLGSHFSTNGDFGAFAVGTTLPVYSARGPINTSELRVKFQGTHITVEDAAIPAMFASIASTALGVLDNAGKAKLFKEKMTLSWQLKALPDLRDLFPLFPNTYDPTSYETPQEMVANIFFFNIMAQDDASGRFELRNDNIDLSWETPVANKPVWAKVESLLQALVTEMGGSYVPFPLWKGLGNKKLVVTHPLGGCPIAPTSMDGAVDEFGRVYDGNKPFGSTDVYPGLYVVDGSAIPGAVATNPTLTIAAQAIKTVNKALP